MTSARVQLGFPLSGRGKEEKRGEGRIGAQTTRPGPGTCACVGSFFCARQSERAEFDRNSLIDGSDSDLNWLFSAPITGWMDGGFAGSARRGRALPNIGRKSHLIRKSDESRDENGDSSGLGRFYGSLSSRRRASHQIKLSRSERGTTRRPWQIAIRWPLPPPSLIPKRRRFRVKNCLLRFENLTCTTTDRCHLSAARRV